MIKEKNPKWSPIQVKLAIKQTALDLKVDKIEQGSGLVQADKAIKYDSLGTWDVDQNNAVDKRDGDMILAYMIGMSAFYNDSTFLNKNIDADSKRKTYGDIEKYIDNLKNKGFLDVDNSGNIGALSDGIMIARYFRSMTGKTMTDGAIALNAKRTDPLQIEQFIANAQIVNSEAQKVWDIDLNSKVDQRDGTLIVGYMFGGSVLAYRVTTDTDIRSQRKTTSEIGDYIKSLDNAKLLDIDGDGKNSVFSDGILLTRYFYGTSGNDLIYNAISPTATRKTPEQIEQFINNIQPVNSEALKVWDADLNSKVDQRDGTLIAAYMFGESTLSGQVSQNIGPDSQRKTVDDIFNYINILDKVKLLDVDGDGKNSATSDGVMLARYFTGIIRNSLIQDAISPTATRKTPEQIELFIANAQLVNSEALKVWDVDLNSKVNQLDGALIRAYMSGGKPTLSGQISQNIGPDSQRKTVDDIFNYINTLDKVKLLDVDGDGKNSATGDGVILTRYFKGIIGNGLIQDRISPTATRMTSEQVEQFIANAQILFYNNPQLVNSESLKVWDIDLNGKVNQLDCTLIIAYMSGKSTLSGQISQNTGPDSQRKTVDDIFNHINILDNAKLLDVDGDGKNSVTGDGFIILRYFNGVTGNGLIQDVISPTATRTTPEQIIDFIYKAQIPI